MRSDRRALVHGDYSLKNVLVEQTDDGSLVWIIDFEVAHWGSPWFDTSFLLNYLVIKAIYNREQWARYIAAAKAFWDAYDQTVSWNVEAETVTELGVLMLARVDGKSPVKYVTDDSVKRTLRTVAKEILQEDLSTLDELKVLVESEVPQ